jgi:hypothetical protein
MDSVKANEKEQQREPLQAVWLVASKVAGMVAVTVAVMAGKKADRMAVQWDVAMVA